ncbi:MAG TPA: ATP-binding protein [Dissulfurispiraceae bacterium]|nr:ATP-binding protein [Dissulfurispiraceae bacterium]
MDVNPFQYGKEVSGEFFCNRKQEIKDLLVHMRSSTNVMVYSQRRFGKTSLIKEALKKASEEGMATVYADLGSVLSERLFVHVYSRAIAESLQGPMEKVISLAKDIFKKLRPTFALDDDTGKPKLEFNVDRGESLPFVEDVLASVDRYQKKLNKKVVVVFDEFQEVGRLETDYLEKRIRSSIQAHKHVSYIFCGSKRHLIYEMFNNPARPFYRSSAHYPIRKIPRDELAKYITERFASSKKTIGDKAVQAVLEICEIHPYYVQYLCHILWDASNGKKIGDNDVRRAVQTLLSRESAAYTNTWDLLTIQQKKMLVALAKKLPEEKISSASFLSKYELGYASTARNALQSLEKKDMVDREGDEYSIIDVMFRRWLLYKYPEQM